LEPSNAIDPERKTPRRVGTGGKDFGNQRRGLSQDGSKHYSKKEKRGERFRGGDLLEDTAGKEERHKKREKRENITKRESKWKPA